MAEIIMTQKLVYLCPHCGDKRIIEDPERNDWKDLDVVTKDNQDIVASLDFEGENYFIYCYRCENCGTLFCIKRLHEQLG